MPFEVLDVTDLLKRAAWSEDRRVTESWFAGGLPSEDVLQRASASFAGLYVLYFENDGDAVHDKNRGWSRGGRGKMVIARNGASLKPGKFEGGFIRRRHQDADHLHRRRDDPFGTTFVDCLKLALFMDLTAHPQLVRPGEAALKAQLKRFIEAPPRNGLASGYNWLGDWRLLGSRIALPVLRESLPGMLKDALLTRG